MMNSPVGRGMFFVGNIRNVNYSNTTGTFTKKMRPLQLRNSTTESSSITRSTIAEHTGTGSSVLRDVRRRYLTSTTTPWNYRTIRNEKSITTLAAIASNVTTQKRYFSKGWTARGHDLTNDLLDYDKEMGIPKISVSGYGENGFMVKNMIQKVNKENSGSEDSESDSDGSIYMNGSIIVYPTGCFLWNLNTNNPAKDVTIESLSSLLLIRPHIEYLFIGCNDGYGSIQNLNAIQRYMRLHSPPNHSVVVEQMQLYNAIGTFNLLNAEDRQVAAALIVDTTNSN